MHMQLSMVVHTCNPSTQEAEAGELGVPGQPGLCSKTLSQKHTNKKIPHSWAPVAHACNPSYSGGRGGRRFEVSLGK
jgi:hypothetical protein